MKIYHLIVDYSRLSSTTETLLVEPHYLNFLFTPLTQDILNQVSNIISSPATL